MGKRANPAIVGAFVVGAVVLAVVGVALFGSGRLFRTTYEYVMYFTGDVNGLKIGAPVKFKGVEIGRVQDILLNVSQMSVFDSSAPQAAAGKVRIPVIIEIDQDALSEKGGHIKPDPKTLKLLIDRGLRGQMAMESFVTGLLYVKLDLFPGSELDLVADSSVRYVEIPTLPTPLEEAQMKAAEFLAKLKEADIKGLIDHLSSTVQGIDRMVNSPKLHETVDTLPVLARNLDAAVSRFSATMESVQGLAKSFDSKVDPLVLSLQSTAKDAAQTMRAATSTLNNADVVLQPSSPVMYQLGRTLADLAEAAQAIRRFAEDLERNPSALVRGKAVPQEEEEK
jgi:paraquat-inducible protein B